MKKRVEKFPLWGQILYSSGSGGFSIADRIWVSFMLYFYLPPAESGMPELISNNTFWGFLTVAGLVTVFGRIVDAIADPLIGYWSDRSTSRLGRRKSFMVYGGLPMMAALALLFFPPTNNASTLNAVYMALMLGLTLFFFTVYVLPYLALIAELSHTESERINLVTIQALFNLVGVIVVMILGYILWGALEKSGMDKATALKATVLVLCGVGLIFCYIAVIPIDEKKYCDSTPSQIGLFQSLKETLANRAFITYIIGTLAFWFGLNIVSQTATYYVTVLLHREEAFSGAVFGAVFGVALVMFPIINLVSKRVGKKAVMVFGLVVFAIATGLLYLLGSETLVLPPTTQAFIIFGIMGIPVSILLLVPNAMLADVAEYDAILTGSRREAMCFSAQGFLEKINLGVSTLILAFLFSQFGKDVAAPLGVQISGPVAGVVCLLGVVGYALYPEKKVQGVLEEYRKNTSSGE